MSLLAYLTDLPRLVESRIERFLEEHRPRWLYVEFSGGKDSAAVLAAAMRVTGRVIAVFLHVAGQTHAENARAALAVARRLGLAVHRVAARRPGDLRRFFLSARPEPPALVYAVVSDHSLGVDYWEAVRRYGFPAPLERLGGGKRWCCAHFKSDWLAERPPNGLYRGRPARFIAVGVRRQESRYRERLWAGRTWQVFEARDGVADVALAPIVDLSDADVWALLKHYGLHDLVRPQYERWGRAPNCVLCPLMGREALERAVRSLPTGYLQRVLTVLREVRPRYREGTWSAAKIDEWLSLIEPELRRRGAGVGAPPLR